MIRMDCAVGVLRLVAAPVVVVRADDGADDDDDVAAATTRALCLSSGSDMFDLDKSSSPSGSINVGT